MWVCAGVCVGVGGGADTDTLGCVVVDVWVCGCGCGMCVFPSRNASYVSFLLVCQATQEIALFQRRMIYPSPVKYGKKTLQGEGSITLIQAVVKKSHK